MQFEYVADFECELGEGAVWHPDDRRLYWVDITTGRLLRYSPATNTSECIHREDAISAVTIQRDGSLLLFLNRGRVARWDGGIETVSTVAPAERDTRFNDVIADPAGRVFCGTMPTADRGGRLFRLDTDGSLDRLEDGIAIPNGLGFTLDRGRLYFTETEAETIHRYRYDESTGAISDRRTFVEATDPGEPDGMTVDSEGCVWSARWKGGSIVRYSADGNELARYEVPARKVTSVAFGGEDLDQLYVTTGGGDDRPDQGEHAGALFRCEPGVTGVEAFRSDIDL